VVKGKGERRKGKGERGKGKGERGKGKGIPYPLQEGKEYGPTPVP
jgi:hypothetical protein